MARQTGINTSTKCVLGWPVAKGGRWCAVSSAQEQLCDSCPACSFLPEFCIMQCVVLHAYLAVWVWSSCWCCCSFGTAATWGCGRCWVMGWGKPTCACHWQALASRCDTACRHCTSITCEYLCTASFVLLLAPQHVVLLQCKVFIAPVYMVCCWHSQAMPVLLPLSSSGNCGCGMRQSLCWGCACSQHACHRYEIFLDLLGSASECAQQRRAVTPTDREALFEK